VVAAELRQGDTEDLLKAMRSVSVDNVAEVVTVDAAKAVHLAAKFNFATVPGSFSRSKAKVTRDDTRIVISGVVAVVAEYGMMGRGWYVPRGRSGKSMARVRTTVPPPRVRGRRPRPEDGHVVGAAWKALRARQTDEAADRMLKEYTIAFDKHGIRKKVV